MREFDYQYANLPYRIKPWDQMRKEEMTYVVYNAYLQNHINSSDVKRLVRLHQAKVFLEYSSIPLLFFGFSRLVRVLGGQFRFFNSRVALFYTVGLSIPTWFLLRAISPAQLAYNAERLRVLEYLDDNMSYGMVSLNKMLPRWWTENWVGGLLRQLYSRRNSPLTGLLYPYEEHAQDFISSPEKMDDVVY